MVLEEMQDGKTAYYRDEAGVHHAQAQPKRDFAVIKKASLKEAGFIDRMERPRTLHSGYAGRPPQTGPIF